MSPKRSLAGVALAALGLCGSCGGGGGGDSGPSYGLALDRSSVTFEADHQGALPPAQTVQVTFVGDGLLVGYPPGVLAATGWLNVAAPSVATQNPFPVTLSLASTQLTPGTYATTLRFVTGKADGSVVKYQDLPVQLTLRDRPTPSASQLSFRTVAGAAAAPAAQALQLGFASSATPWAIEVDQPWLHVDRAAGQGTASVQVTVDPSGLPAGSRTAALRVRPGNGGSSATVAVTLECRPRRIWASRNGLALASGLGIDALGAEVVLYDNGHGSGNDWSATSDQAWLSAHVSPPDRLTVTAYPAGLPPGMSYATVTVRSSAAEVENSEPIRVGLWKTELDPVAGALADVSTTWDVNGVNVATAVDPVRPWLYVVETAGSTVRALNVYTGAQEAAFPAIPGQQLDSLVASSDGRWLFAKGAASPSLFRLAVDTGTWSAGFPYRPQITGALRMAYLRPEGHPLVLSGGAVVDAESGAQLTTNLVMPAEPLHSSLVTQDQIHLVDHSRHALELDPVARSLTATRLQGVPATQSPVDLAINKDGSLVWMGGNLAQGYGFTSYRLAPGSGYALESTLTCAAYPQSVEVGENDVLYAGRSAYYDPDTVSAYGPDGSLLHVYSIGTYRWLLPDKKGLMLSGDGQRLLLVSTEFVYGDKTTLWGFPAQR